MLLDDDDVDVDDADATARKARYLVVDKPDDGAARTRKISSFRIL